MKNDLDKTEKAVLLRQKAEQLLKNKLSGKTADLTEADTIKLIYELEVHQIELEIQQEELQQAKEKAEECAVHFKNLYNNINDSVFYQDSVTGNIISANETAKRIYGYSDDEFRRMEIKQLDNENNVLKIEKQRKTLIEKGFVNFESVHITKGGKFFPVEAKVKIIDEKTFISVSRDITDRKKADQALKESEAKYRTIIENSGDAIAIRQKGKFEFANNAFSKMSDYSIIELAGIENSLIFDSDILNDMEKRLSKNDLNENLPIQFETMITKKDKTKIDVEIFEKSISYNKEKAQLLIVRDITKQKAIMKVLQRGAEQTKGLNGYIPVCAGCSLIRDDEKENKPWVKPADYITERLPEIQFSHGMCPDCMKKWYPDIEK